MPIAAGSLHILIAIFFAVHAVRSGKQNYWLFVLFAFPLLGSAVYFFAEYLPTLRHTHGGRRAARLMQNIVDPNRALREATREFDRTPTAYNEAQLARAHLAKGNVDQAIEHYRHCCSGPYAKDVSFLKGLAISLFEGGKHEESAQTLERLFSVDADQRRGDLALLYAEALSGAKRPEADAVFAQVVAADSSIEARYKHGVHLLERGREREARQSLEAALADARRNDRHSRELNAEWIRDARQMLKRLESGQATPAI